MSTQPKSQPSGLLREDKTAKPDFTYVGMVYSSIARIMQRFMMGEAKYARGNWRECEDILTYQQSAVRHLMQYLNGQTDEDHIAAAATNLIILMDLEELKRDGITNRCGDPNCLTCGVRPKARNAN